MNRFRIFTRITQANYVLLPLWLSLLCIMGNAQPVHAGENACKDCLESITTVCEEQCQKKNEGFLRASCNKTCAAKNCSTYCSEAELGSENSNAEASANCDVSCLEKHKPRCQRRCQTRGENRRATCEEKCLKRKCGEGCPSAQVDRPFPEEVREQGTKSRRCERCEKRTERRCERVCKRAPEPDRALCSSACLQERCTRACGS